MVDSTGHVLAGDDPGLLNRPPARQFGEALVSEVKRSPDHSMVVLPGHTSLRSPDQAGFPRDILVAAGIPDKQGIVAGALVLRLDPRLELSRILQRGRLGESGETYAFTRSGSMISESRFHDQLRRIEALSAAPDQAAGPSIELRDPGVDLTAGGRPAAPRPRQPLTRMARSALAGYSGVDLEGYRDYRGVPVIGVTGRAVRS